MRPRLARQSIHRKMYRRMVPRTAGTVTHTHHTQHSDWTSEPCLFLGGAGMCLYLLYEARRPLRIPVTTGTRLGCRRSRAGKTAAWPHKTRNTGVVTVCYLGKATIDTHDRPLFRSPTSPPGVVSAEPCVPSPLASTYKCSSTSPHLALLVFLRALYLLLSLCPPDIPWYYCATVIELFLLLPLLMLPPPLHCSLPGTAALLHAPDVALLQLLLSPPPPLLPLVLRAAARTGVPSVRVNHCHRGARERRPSRPHHQQPAARGMADHPG